MSNTDSFIEEVNEEVRRDRFYHYLRRYGWIGAVLVLVIVGGAAWTEYQKAQARAEAQAFGDGVLAALAQNDANERRARLSLVDPENQAAQAVLDMLIAAEAEQAGDTGAAVAALESAALNSDAPEIYRQIAAFKSLVLQADTLDAETRRQQFEALARPGQPLSLLAQEQLALIDIVEGETDAAINRFQQIVQDAGVSTALQQRALQSIVSLGGTPNVANLPGLAN
jgi:hypothetical protein